ncbi:hypothetical protein [Streptomyces sp. 6N106]
METAARAHWRPTTKILSMLADACHHGQPPMTCKQITIAMGTGCALSKI